MRRMKCGGTSSMNASFLVASDEFVDGDGDFGDSRGQGEGHGNVIAQSGVHTFAMNGVCFQWWFVGR
jgi:hypothetical protein